MRGWSIVMFAWVLGCAPERAESIDPPKDPPTDQTDPPPVPQPAVEPAPPPKPESEPEPPPPEPAPFAGRETVRVEELLAAIIDELPAIAASPAVRDDYDAFRAAFELEHDETLYLDYVRIKVAFEATRAGGWWGVEWDITNEQPNSDKIWAQWQALELGPAPATVDSLTPLPLVTATAECDELSALFAFVVQRIGLSDESDVGLFWPVWNHVVAVWTIHPKSDKPTRVVVPTSQIFLDYDESLGTDGFDPWTQKHIYDYRRKDARKDLKLPGPLAAAFVQAVRDHGGRSQDDLQTERNAKEDKQKWAAAKDYSDPKSRAK